MLRSHQRLRRSRDFAKLYQRGKFGKSTHFTIKTLANNQPYTRIGVVISKKVLKKAVARNRARRRITELIRPMYEDLKSGYDCVLILKRDIVDLKPSALESELKEIFVSSGIVQ